MDWVHTGLRFMITVGSIFELRKEDTTLAHLSNVQVVDWPWFICDFAPTPAFEQYRPLFERELALIETHRTENVGDQLELASTEIENLNLKLIDLTTAKTGEVLIHVDGGNVLVPNAFRVIR